VAPSDAAGPPGRSQRPGEPSRSAETSTLNGSSWILTVPLPVSPSTRSALMVKSSGQGAATHGCASASRSLLEGGPAGVVAVVVTVAPDDCGATPPPRRRENR
jgi:hypothetical protein